MLVSMMHGSAPSSAEPASALALVVSSDNEEQQPGYARAPRMVDVTAGVAKQSITAACWS